MECSGITGFMFNIKRYVEGFLQTFRTLMMNMDYKDQYDRKETDLKTASC